MSLVKLTQIESCNGGVIERLAAFIKLNLPIHREVELISYYCHQFPSKCAYGVFPNKPFVISTANSLGTSNI